MASDDEGDFHNEEQDPPEIDEANVQEGLRAFFPLSFGKQEKKEVTLESIHSTTKRPHDPQPKPLKPQSGKKGWLQDLNPKPLGPLRPSPDLVELPRPPIGPQRPPSNLVELPRPPIGPQRPPTDSAEPILGPPMPPYLEESAIGDEDDSDQLVGPPRPPQFSGDADEEEGPLVGPPRPPPNLEEDGNNGSFEAMTYRREDETSDEYSDEEGGDMLRVPLSNEIMLKGHTKDILAEKRVDVANRIIYEASARVVDPIYGCISAIFRLQKPLLNLQSQLAITLAELLMHRPILWL